TEAIHYFPSPSPPAGRPDTGTGRHVLPTVVHNASSLPLTGCLCRCPCPSLVLVVPKVFSERKERRSWLGGLEGLHCGLLPLCHSACSGGLTRVYSRRCLCHTHSPSAWTGHCKGRWLLVLELKPT
ncbi:mCG141058, partial [Mus musculus]